MADKKQKQKKAIDIICRIFMTLFFLACVSALFYPYVSNLLAKVEQNSSIVSYTNAVNKIDPEKAAQMLKEAQDYNKRLAEHPTGFVLTEEQTEEYNSLLNITDQGVMGHIEIPSIDVVLPIYHSVEESVLQVAAGHLPGSSLPVGGKGTHTILSGHRGLTSATLFTNLDKLEEGDVFYIYVLNDVLAYEIDDIKTVLPSEINSLSIDSEQDYCTLVTCTPYGVNSHRLLVRGHRIESPPVELDDESGSYRILTPAEKKDIVPLAKILAGVGLALVLGALTVLIMKAVKKRKIARHNGGD